MLLHVLAACQVKGVAAANSYASMAIEPRPTRHGRILLVGTVARLKPTSTSLHDGRGQSLGFEGDATRLWSHFTMKFTRGKELVAFEAGTDPHFHT
ncbi:hypothetical protein F441_04061 [Phytophthora nicotianae CJ01A1]|nr:hypothetical protein PPTG_22319 [Phytophthora nicotianae INRA-310]ETN13241.1 hypothetical protein PPTG_22319 [Phytophthora nicotianae INRA-310]ETP22695.1 hypothetical protein F441_04061 [Phytophthora nicotianae CJ01A1]ETP50673.1 hypothetical protein F442_04069 [Phytophthora nicotianae P10297]